MHRSRKPKLSSFIGGYESERNLQTSNGSRVEYNNHAPVFGPTSYVKRVVCNYALEYAIAPRKLISVPNYLFQFIKDIFNFEKTLSQFLGIDVEIVRGLQKAVRTSDLNTHLNLSKSSASGLPLAFYSPFWGPLLYSITKVIKPSSVLETGVAQGVSSAYILQALDDNQFGALRSLDLPTYKSHGRCNQNGRVCYRETGELVPDKFKSGPDSRWTLSAVNITKDSLNSVIEEISPIDIFVHDSDHRAEHMHMELSHVWKNLNHNGVLIVDDIWPNSTGFEAFLREIPEEERAVAMFGSVGLVRRLNPEDIELSKS